MYARYRFVLYAAVCHYRPFVYVYGVPDGVKPCHRVFTQSGTRLCMYLEYLTR
jgi:hypothetical protein